MRKKELLKLQADNEEHTHLAEHVLPPEAVSKKDEEILREQSIDQNGPGTILRDFETLLDMIGSEGGKVSAKSQQFTFDTLVELNSRLTHPIAIDLKRPRQKSYSNIHGLYLVLRSSGLGRVRQTKKGQRMVVDQEMLTAWKKLNPVEKYCTLLESWLLRGDPQILNEGWSRLRFWIPECHKFVQKIPKSGMDIAGKINTFEIKYAVDLYGLALLRFFGLLSMKEFQPESGKGWNGRIYRTAFGNALLNVLKKILETNDHTLFFSLDFIETSKTFGLLQPALSPFFPRWQKTFQGPEKENKPGLYTFKVSLSKNCWRRIQIPDQNSLESLSLAILNSFEFDHNHLYSFEYTNRFGQPVEIFHPYMQDGLYYTDEVLVGEMDLEPGNRLLYTYDFGDQWKFNVVLETIDPPDGRVKTPRVTTVHGRSPEQYA